MLKQFSAIEKGEMERKLLRINFCETKENYGKFKAYFGKWSSNKFMEMEEKLYYKLERVFCLQNIVTI